MYTFCVKCGKSGHMAVDFKDAWLAASQDLYKRLGQQLLALEQQLPHADTQKVHKFLGNPGHQSPEYSN